MANDLKSSFEQWLSSRLFTVKPSAPRQPEILERQVDMVCNVVRDRLETHPESTEAELTTVATAAATAVAAGVAVLLAAPITSSAA